MKYKNLSFSDKFLSFLVYFLIALVILVTLYPLYFVLIASFSDSTEVSRGATLLLPSKITLEGYTRVFEDARIWRGYLNTILYTLVGTTISVSCTIPAAYALSRKELPFRRGITFFFSFTMFFGGGLIPTYFLMQDLHLVDTFWVMVIPFAVSVYNVIVARSFFQTSIPEELFEAAQIDGCTYSRFFLQMVLPLSKAIVAVMALYYAVGYWNEYMRALIYLRNTELVPLQLVLKEILVANQAFEQINMDNALKQRLADTMKYAVIIISTLPMLVLYPLLQKYFEKGVMIGSLKG